MLTKSQLQSQLCLKHTKLTNRRWWGQQNIIKSLVCLFFLLFLHNLRFLYLFNTVRKLLQINIDGCLWALRNCYSSFFFELLQQLTCRRLPGRTVCATSSIPAPARAGGGRTAWNATSTADTSTAAAASSTAMPATAATRPTLNEPGVGSICQLNPSVTSVVRYLCNVTARWKSSRLITYSRTVSPCQLIAFTSCYLTLVTGACQRAYKIKHVIRMNIYIRFL
jgi:hypothetical protein